MSGGSLLTEQSRVSSVHLLGAARGWGPEGSADRAHARSSGSWKGCGESAERSQEPCCSVS